MKNPKWKMILYVKEGEIVSESDVSACFPEAWVKAKSDHDGRCIGTLTVYYVDSDDLEVGDVPSSS